MKTKSFICSVLSMLVFTSFSQEASKINKPETVDNNINSSSERCDTSFVEDYFFKINTSALTTTKIIQPIPVIVDTIGTADNVRYKNKIIIADNIFFYYYSNCDFIPMDDYEYFTVDNETIYIDMLYFNKIQNDITFRSYGEINIYKFSEMNYIYYSVFISNLSSQIAHGNCLFLFCSDTLTKHNQLILFSANQVANDVRCFGINRNDNSLTYFDWDFVQTMLFNKPYYDVYYIKSGKLSFVEHSNLNIKAINKWQIVFCN